MLTRTLSFNSNCQKMLPWQFTLNRSHAMNYMEFEVRTNVPQDCAHPARVTYTAFTLCSRWPRQPRSNISLFSRSITSCYVFLRCFTISVTSRGSDKPVCHGGSKVRDGCPRSITIISTFYYGLLRSVAVSCVLTKA